MSVTYMRKFSSYEHHFFISWVWFPNAFHSHSIYYLHQVPLETKFSISNSAKELSRGETTALVINRGGREDWRRKVWIYINGKISLNFFASCNLASTFIFTVRCFLLPVLI